MKETSTEPIVRLGGTPEGESGIKMVGHREYVGGMWELIGKLQFNFIVGQGLKPENCFLDIACGPLRGGIHFIPYLLIVRSFFEQKLRIKVSSWYDQGTYHPSRTSR